MNVEGGPIQKYEKCSVPKRLNKPAHTKCVFQFFLIPRSQKLSVSNLPASYD